MSPHDPSLMARFITVRAAEHDLMSPYRPASTRVVTNGQHSATTSFAAAKAVAMAQATRLTSVTDITIGSTPIRAMRPS